MVKDDVLLLILAVLTNNVLRFSQGKKSVLQ